MQVLACSPAGSTGSCSPMAGALSGRCTCGNSMRGGLEEHPARIAPSGLCLGSIPCITSYLQQQWDRQSLLSLAVLHARLVDLAYIFPRVSQGHTSSSGDGPRAPRSQGHSWWSAQVLSRALGTEKGIAAYPVPFLCSPASSRKLVREGVELHMQAGEVLGCCRGVPTVLESPEARHGLFCHSPS